MKVAAALAGASGTTSLAGLYNKVGKYMYRQHPKQKTGRSSTSSKIATNQFNVQRWYSKKRMPRRKKKQWKKFSKKVKAVFNKQLAPTFMLRRETGTVSSADNLQTSFTSLLYGGNGTSGSNDLQVIKQSLGVTVGLNKLKYRFESAVLDLALQASSENTNTCYVDIYEILCRKSLANANYNSPNSLFQDMSNIANQDPNADTKISYTDIGSTPFTNVLFCSYFKILNKRTLTLSPGQVAELQMRDSTNHNLWGGDVTSLSALKGLTRGYLMIVRGQFNGTKTPASTVNFAYTRHYCLRQISNDNVPISGIN